MKKMLVAAAAVLALTAVSAQARVHVTPRGAEPAMLGPVLPRPFHFGPRLPLVRFQVVTEIDYEKKLVAISVPVESPAFAALDWAAKTTLFLDGGKAAETMMNPGVAVVLQAEQELDQAAHVACIRLERVGDPIGEDILPDARRMDCRAFTHFGTPPRRNSLGR